jgi:hypothetical protein
MSQMPTDLKDRYAQLRQTPRQMRIVTDFLSKLGNSNGKYYLNRSLIGCSAATIDAAPMPIAAAVALVAAPVVAPTTTVAPITTTTAPTTTTAAPVTYKEYGPGIDCISGYDIGPCGQFSTEDEIKNACSTNPNCTGYTMVNGNPHCMKNANITTHTMGFTSGHTCFRKQIPEQADPNRPFGVGAGCDNLNQCSAGYKCLGCGYNNDRGMKKCITQATCNSQNTNDCGIWHKGAAGDGACDWTGSRCKKNTFDNITACQCKAECENYPRGLCKAWHHYTNGGKCWLKRQVDLDYNGNGVGAAK